MTKEEKEKGVKKIEVSEEMLKELIEDNRKKDGLLNQLAEDMEKMRQNSASESSKAGLPRIVRKNSEMFVGLLKYDNKYFVGYVNKGTERKPTYVYPEYDERMREIVQKCDVILLGEDNKPLKPIKLNYFLRRL